MQLGEGDLLPQFNTHSHSETLRIRGERVSQLHFAQVTGLSSSIRCLRSAALRASADMQRMVLE